MNTKSLRLPRKKKKQAKKLKAKADAGIMAQLMFVKANTAVRLAMISTTPNNHPSDIALKALSVFDVVRDSAETINKIASQIKPWYEHINYKR